MNDNMDPPKKTIDQNSNLPRFTEDLQDVFSLNNKRKNLKDRINQIKP